MNDIHGLNVERRSEILAGFTPAVLLTSDVPPFPFASPCKAQKTSNIQRHATSVFHTAKV